MNKLVYNGVDLRDYGLYVSGDKTFNSPAKEYTKVSIPGRSGDLFYYDGRFSNITVQYNCIVIPTALTNGDTRTEEQRFIDNTASIRQTLLSPTGYARIEDDYHPDEYRMGVYKGPFEISTGMLKAGAAVLEFDCQPERWLKSGEVTTNVSIGTSQSGNRSSGIVLNPTAFNAYPIIKLRVTGGAKLSVYICESTSGSYDVNKKIGGVITLDFPIAGIYWIDTLAMDCSNYTYDSSTQTYSRSSSANNCMTVSNFPYFRANGYSALIVDKTEGTINDLQYTPRWYLI